MKVLILAVLLIVGVVNNNAKKSVKLSLYYQTFCGDCALFIVNQLYPTWVRYGDRLRVDIVPFGGTEFTFDLLQACAIYDPCGINGTLDCPVPKLRKAMDYLHCSEKENKTILNHIKCANASGLNLKAVDECATGVIGDQLEKKYIAQANAVKPKIKFIPRIHINDIYNKTIEEDAAQDLMKVISTYLK